MTCQVAFLLRSLRISRHDRDTLFDDRAGGISHQSRGRAVPNPNLFIEYFTAQNSKKISWAVPVFSENPISLA